MQVIRQRIVDSLNLRVSEQLPRTACLADRLTVVRSMTHAVANHNPATYLTLTGRTSTRDVARRISAS